MSLLIKFFLKMLCYTAIIVIARKIINKIQMPTETMLNTEVGERFISRKIYSIILLIVGFIFSFFVILITNFSSDFDNGFGRMVIACFVAVVLFLYLMSFLYGCFYVEIGKDKIYWRKMNGREGKIKYEDITLYTIDGSGNLKLYQDDQCVLKFAMEEDRTFITEVLKNIK